MGSYSGGKWQSLSEKLASAQRKNQNPRRGGKRASANEMEHTAFRNEIARQGKTASKPVAKKPMAQKATSRASSPSSLPRVKIPKAQMETKVSDVKNDIVAPSSSVKANRDIKLGAIAGRTGGKWHLGKKVGKG
jgi:sRNA-binding protein